MSSNEDFGAVFGGFTLRILPAYQKNGLGARFNVHTLDNGAALGVCPTAKVRSSLGFLIEMRGARSCRLALHE